MSTDPLCSDDRLAANRISALQPTAVNAILAEVRAAQAQGQSLISLMRGEPDFPTPAHVVEASIRALRNGRTSYPDNRGEKIFREAVAQKLERDNRLKFDPASEVLATTGATLGVYAALMAMLNEGDEVLLPDPVYDAYQSPIRMAGGRIKSVRIADRRWTIRRHRRSFRASLVARGVGHGFEYAVESGGHCIAARRVGNDRAVLRSP